MIQPIGYFKLHRELFGKPIWEKSTLEQKVILITLLSMANFADKQWEWQGKQFRAKPGQFVTSLDSIVKNAGSGVSIKNVRTALERFEKLEFLANESAKTGRLITILNWELYQSNDDEVAKKPADTRQRGGKQVATREEGKEGKKVKNIKHIDVYRMIQHLPLSTSDYEELKSIYGQTSVDDILNQMENYAGLSKYKSAKLTASNWLKKSKEPPKTKTTTTKTNKFNNYEANKHNYSNEELEKKLGIRK